MAVGSYKRYVGIRRLHYCGQRRKNPHMVNTVMDEFTSTERMHMYIIDMSMNVLAKVPRF